MNLKPTIIILIILCGVSLFSIAQSEISKVWVADNGDGTYKNPIIHADYSDPDVVRVGDDYYMTASSFNCVPGLPILHSKDLVNWQLITYALPTQLPEDVFNIPQHGNGVWAPCIRYHNNEFYIYYPDPDFGIYQIKAKQAEGPWSEPILVKAGKGLIDPSPLWDDDGKVYLTHAFAGSRARVKSVLLVQEMNSEGTAVIGDEVMVFDGHDAHPTVEGPKFYKANGYYYIFAPAGGVSTGWQLVLRSKNVYGPYETKTVMAQGKTAINGPHQGAWVNTKSGEHWFIHFQDKEAYGRVVHLNPMTWKNDWPVIGIDKDGDGIGEPVLTYQKPDVGATYPISTPPESDEFNRSQLGIQWQWQANKHISYGFPSGNLGFYRLNCIVRPEGEDGLWSIPNLLLQKFPSEEFTATTKITFNARTNNEETGFVVMGEDYQYISLKQINKQLQLRVAKCENARTGGKEMELHTETFNNNEIYFRIEVEKGAICTFSYSSNGKTFKTVGEAFTAKPGRWIGAKIGYVALREGITNDSGTVDIDWFRVDK
ncbi:glycoside hydrolase 43 family protein [Draconibacterium orientale]|uniref:glycoside hydrolase family 43 protein n=1 Tax=Draconibacterium orientale TaxID=1168034 RepID=UPI0029C08013|nr:glycoside hydrolase 43 family protein [Draconibacterium orientale]